MCPTNDFLPFCPTNTGTNLLTESEYAASDDRDSGNKPGVASSKLNNKAIRQSTYVAANIGALLAYLTGTDILDDAIPAKLLAQMKAGLAPLDPIATKYASGSGTHNLTYQFFIATGSATVGATYTNNSVTFTVVATVASGLVIQMTGNGAPSVSGILTKASGTGDATLTFYAVRAPKSLRIQLVGGGAGGGGGGTAGGTAAADGAASTFGSNSAGGGIKGVWDGNGGAGGASSLAAGFIGLAVTGGGGYSACRSTGTSGRPAGGNGGSSALGGAGIGGAAGNTSTGAAGVVNTGGGGGGGESGGGSGPSSGSGGGSGGYVDALISPPASTYAYAVGAGGAAGGAGTSGPAGGAGASGVVVVTELYQ